jgi:ABC-2 type transport system permease protein
MQIGLRVGPNPIIVKELRSRMRGARAFVILAGTLLLLAAISYALYRIVLSTSSYSYSPLSPKIGQILFIWLALLELLIVCFLTPAITAGAISGERENLTYEMLLATSLRPASILRGKLISALSYVFMLIFAAIPLFSLVFIFGGVAPRDLLKALIILVAVTVMWGMTSVFFSVWLKRTARATVLSYLAVLLMLLGPIFVYILSGVLRNAEPPRWILIPNPLSALFSAVNPSMPDDGLSGIFMGLSIFLGGNLSRVDELGFSGGIPRPLYHYALPLYGMLTLVLYLLSVQMVQPVRRWRVRWKELLAALALLLLFIGVVVLAFVTTAHRYEGAGLFSGLTPTPVPRSVNVPLPVIAEGVVVEVDMAPVLQPTEVPIAAMPSSTPLPMVW